MSLLATTIILSSFISQQSSISSTDAIEYPPEIMNELTACRLDKTNAERGALQYEATISKQSLEITELSTALHRCTQQAQHLCDDDAKQLLIARAEEDRLRRMLNQYSEQLNQNNRIISYLSQQLYRLLRLDQAGLDGSSSGTGTHTAILTNNRCDGSLSTMACDCLTKDQCPARQDCIWNDEECSDKSNGIEEEKKVQCSSIWDQCGGNSWSGALCCVDGCVCNYQSEWYSQCVPQDQVWPDVWQ